MAEALDVARQIAGALEAAHEKGIVHRDLKPANVKRRSDGLVKVLDFGLAKAFDGDAAGPKLGSPTVTSTATRAGVVLGTAAVHESRAGARMTVDARTDIWSFGCVLYEMLTGRMAFDGRTTPTSSRRCLEHEPDWTRLPKNTPAGYDGSSSDVSTRIRGGAAGHRRGAGGNRAGERITVASSFRRKPLAFGDIVGMQRWCSERCSTASAGGRGSPCGHEWVGLWPRLRPRSLAILPFRALDQADEYLGHGVTSDVITKVSQIHELTVRPRSAVVKYAGGSGSALDAARELNVDAVVEGTVQRQGSQVRVNVNLISVQSGASIWSGTIDVDAASTFEIQDRLSREIAARLRLTLTPQETARLAKQYTTSARAYELYVQGMQAFDRTRHPARRSGPRHGVGPVRAGHCRGPSLRAGARPARVLPRVEGAVQRALQSSMDPTGA